MNAKPPPERKTVYIITGPESSGSTFIAQIIAYVVGLGDSFQDWNGRGQLGEVGDNVVVLHRSQPHGDSLYLTIDQLEVMFPHYTLKFIICTRDKTIMCMSNIERRNKSVLQQHAEHDHAIRIMKSIMCSAHPFFIWSYETFMLMKNAYLDVLYPYLGALRPFELSEDSFKDANIRFIEKINKNSHYYGSFA